jgi:hypothetical protein
MRHGAFFFRGFWDVLEPGTSVGPDCCVGPMAGRGAGASMMHRNHPTPSLASEFEFAPGDVIATQ